MTLPPHPHLTSDAFVIDLRRDAPSPPVSVLTEPGARANELWVRVDSPLEPTSGMTHDTGGAHHSPVLEPRPLEIEGDEPLALGLQRISLHQFDVALQGLRRDDDLDAGIRDARGALRRVGAVVGLVADVLHDEVLRAESAVLRDAHRALDSVRISALRIETAHRVARSVLGANLAEGLDHALRRKHDDQSEVFACDGQIMTDLKTTVSCCRARFASWPVHPGVHPEPSVRIPIPDHFHSIAGGMRRSYRDGRAALHAALEEPRPRALLAWRTHARSLRYQLEIMHPAWPQVLGGLNTTMSNMTGLLGDDNALGDLAGAISSDPALLPDPASRHAVILELERRRYHLRRRAYELARLVYQEPTRAFVRRFEGYWKGWRS